MSPARLEARMDSLFSFPVGLFHPLQHAGLSRRSPYNRETVDWKIRRDQLEFTCPRYRSMKGHAPFWINASTLMWLLSVFSRQPPDQGRVLSYCDFSSSTESKVT